MQPDRRQFLKHLGWLSASGAVAATGTPALAASPHGKAPADPMGVLVDLGACIGCRQCEYACRRANGIEAGPIESYDDQTIFATYRRPQPDAFTVVNAFPRTDAMKAPHATPAASTNGHALPTSNGAANGQRNGHTNGLSDVYAKINCMHCNEPACVSACIVGALRKQEDGTVTYDAWKCIGCRYCMVACPFQIPAYSYDDVLTPEVLKCAFCRDRTSQGQSPACVEICPRDAMTFGRRNDLIALAHQKIARHPGRYVNHVYGEHEVGGTSWMYLSPVPFEQAGFLTLGNAAPGALTEAIQHGVFKYWIAPVGWYGFLATMMWWTGRRAKQKKLQSQPQPREERAAITVNGHAIALAGVPTHAAVAQLAASPSLESEPSALGIERSVDSMEPPDSHLPFAGAGRADLKPQPRTHGPGDSGNGSHHQEHDHALPLDQKLLTPGVWVLIALVLSGLGFGLYRFIFGLGASTNLDQQFPWGLWIAMDVGSGIALAGGGFITAALVHIFHREHYHAIARSALLMALLGYTFYVPGLLADIGRWYNIWHPILPSMWQGNSVLFEVGICVMLYLNVQYAELMPIMCERVMGTRWRFPRLACLAGFLHRHLERIMPALLVLGVALSTFHQSSLGNLMVIAPYKLHELWWSPVMPVHFLLSAMMVGFPMVIFTILTVSWSVKRLPEMHVLTPLSRYIPVFLTLYLGTKIGDIIVRGSWVHLGDVTLQSVSWIVEMLLVIVPLAMLLRPSVRGSERWLAIACLMVILGVVLNRLNVFVLAYHPPFAEKAYFPSIPEFGLSIGLVAALMLTYRVAVNYLPILSPRPRRES
jgi:Ni/Fe-hydrogenase subunit HybB-like protein/Fe-S-cluster-containing dehydrogenase component